MKNLRALFELLVYDLITYSSGKLNYANLGDLVGLVFCLVHDHFLNVLHGLRKNVSYLRAFSFVT